MPIYSYRCEVCGQESDVLQKISDPILTICPTCHRSSFKKKITSARFHLKGSGWYVTDFRGSEKKTEHSRDSVAGNDSKQSGKAVSDKSSSGVCVGSNPVKGEV